jgi:hypothetical protein
VETICKAERPITIGSLLLFRGLLESIRRSGRGFFDKSRALGYYTARSC